MGVLKQTIKILHLLIKATHVFNQALKERVVVF